MLTTILKKQKEAATKELFWKKKIKKGLFLKFRQNL